VKRIGGNSRKPITAAINIEPHSRLISTAIKVCERVIVYIFSSAD